MLADRFANKLCTNKRPKLSKRYHANGSTINLQLSIWQTVKGGINGNQNQDRRKGAAHKWEMFRAAYKANKKGETKKIVHFQTSF